MSLRPDTLADATAPTIRLDGAGLRRWAQRAATELQRRRSEINGLNVYPVPDSDTGSNMSFTMDSALAQATETPDNQVATALAMGAARGARGNSGVILSQVLRGIADSCPDSCLQAPQLRSALHSAVELSEITHTANSAWDKAFQNDKPVLNPTDIATDITYRVPLGFEAAEA